MMRRRMQGISLVELLIAVALSSGMIAMTGQAIASIHRTQRTIEAASEATENASHALWWLARDVRRAGFYASPNADNVAASSALFCSGTAHVMALFPVMVPNQFPTNCWRSELSGRGALITLYADPGATGSIDTSDASRLVVSDMPTGELRWSYPPLATSQTPIGTAHLHAYYVDDTANDDEEQCGGRIPALFLETRERSGREPRQEVARGIERVAFQYGIDSDGDRRVDRYDFAPAASDWAHVYAVKIWVLARSTCPDPAHHDASRYQIGVTSLTADDGYHRQLLTTTVALRGRDGAWSGL